LKATLTQDSPEDDKTPLINQPTHNNNTTTAKHQQRFKNKAIRRSINKAAPAASKQSP
jgi:hypothetical protein